MYNTHAFYMYFAASSHHEIDLCIYISRSRDLSLSIHNDGCVIICAEYLTKIILDTESVFCCSGCFGGSCCWYCSCFYSLSRECFYCCCCKQLTNSLGHS